MGAVTAPALTYDHVDREATPYPADLLQDGWTGLSLFSAAFHGINDGIHMARKGMAVDCVDVDAEKLVEMEAIYPEAWTFTVEDAWEFADDARQNGRTWDVVSVDPFLGDAAERAWRSIPLWMSLAREMVTLTVPNNPAFSWPVSQGWASSIFPRTGRASWLVLRRA